MVLNEWNPEELQSKIKAGGIVLVDFKAPWCPRCDPQVRALERVAPDYTEHADIGTLDLGIYEDAGSNYHLSALPTLLIFKDGILNQELKGYTKAPLIVKALDKVLSK